MLDAALDGIEVQPVPWWLYLGLAIALMVTGIAIRLLVLPYRNVQTGKLIPEPTVRLMMAAKDAEIAHLTGEVDRWIGVYHIADSAYKELAQSIDENTDAMRAALVAPRQPEPPIRTNTNSEGPANARRRERA